MKNTSIKTLKAAWICLYDVPAEHELWSEINEALADRLSYEDYIFFTTGYEKAWAMAKETA